MVCPQCKTRKVAGPRHRACARCRMGEELWQLSKVRDHAARRAKNRAGKDRRALERAARAQARMRAKLLAAMCKLLRETAKAKQVRALSCNPASVAYLTRYHADPLFKESERLRVRDRKIARRYGRAVPADGSLSPAALAVLMAKTRACHYCRRVLSTREKTLDHLVPLSKGGGHSILNAVVSCHSCNSVKRDRDVRVAMSVDSQIPLLMEAA